MTQQVESWSGKKPSKIDPEDINGMATLSDCGVVLKRAVELRRASHSIQAMNATYHIIEQETSKLNDSNYNNDENPITKEIGNIINFNT